MISNNDGFTGNLYKVGDASQRDLELINKYTMNPLGVDDVFVFNIKLCNNDIDRAYDGMTENFLNDVASRIPGLSGLLDHDWSSNNQLSRIYDACVESEDGKFTQYGTPFKYVLCKAYTLKKYSDFVDKINAGLLSEVSISFKSSGDKCSICGSPMTLDDKGSYVCDNGHRVGNKYDNVLCFRVIDKLVDLMEWSLVAVPCQQEASIKNKFFVKGDDIMKRAELWARLATSKAATKPTTKEDKPVDVPGADTKGYSEDVTDDDIKRLIEENVELKSRVEALEDELSTTKKAYDTDVKGLFVDKALDESGLVFPSVKELLKKEIELDKLEMDNGELKGLCDVIEELKKKYSDMFEKADDPDKTTEVIEELGDTTTSKGLQGGFLKPSSLRAASSVAGGTNNKGVGSKKSVRTGIYFS